MRNLKLHITFLIFTLLLTGMGSRTTICLSPDGEAHVEQSQFPCDLGQGCVAVGQLEEQGDCLDVSVGGAASDHRLRGSVQLPPPLLVPLGAPASIALTTPKISSHPQSFPLPQLASLRSIVLLI